MGIIIPNEIEFSSEGLFFGQVIIPKKDHVTRWDFGKMTIVSRPDLSVGPVLSITDLTTGNRYQELPAYVDFLIRREIKAAVKMLPLHQLVTPYLYGKGKFPEWIIGRICGFSDNVNGVFKKYHIVDIQSGKTYKLSIDNMDVLARKESSFLPEA